MGNKETFYGKEKVSKGRFYPQLLETVKPLTMSMPTLSLPYIAKQNILSIDTRKTFGSTNL